MMIIPPEHMYFVAIDEFDYLVECVMRGRTTFSRALQSAVQRDSVRETHCFMLIQHLLKDFPGVEDPEYLETEFEALCERARGAVAAGG